MKFSIFFALFLSVQLSHAEVLLVPSADRSFGLYKEACQKNGYTCTMNHHLAELQNQATPQFDLLLQDLDYSSPTFCEELATRILNILKTEMISVEQVEILLKILEQAQNFLTSQKTKPLLAIAKQLRENLQLIKSEEIKDLPAEFLVLFKKALPLATTTKIQTGFLKTKIEKIDFRKVLSSEELLITNTCDNENVHSSIQRIKWQSDRENVCRFSEQWDRVSSSTSHFISENKGTLITVGVIAIGTALLLNNYEVQIAF